MSVNIKTANGLQRIAGSTVILDATASEIRSGTFTMNNSPSGWCIVNITFDIPMPDTEYVVNIESSEFAGDFITPWRITDKTVNGFKLSIYGNVSSATGKYYAIRLVKLDGYTEVQNKVNNPDSVPTENSTNLVESGGVYEMIQNAPSTFIGTTAEWDALSISEKVKYKIVNITDDYDDNEKIITVDITRTGAADGSVVVVKKSGRVVYVNLSSLITPPTDSAGNVSMFSGLPRPVRACRFVALSLGSSLSSGNNPVLFQVREDGALITDGMGAPANTNYWGSFVYLTND